MHKIAFAVLLVVANLAYGDPNHRCADAATKQAQKLLSFHAGPDDRIEIDKTVKVLGPMRNPRNKSQTFDVLEVWGFIYKGEYRMHFIYAQMPGACLLMGQEIIEFSSL
ncbi:MAG: hypothetical protein WCK63_14230 [Betaproteobacteria bacterium]